ncbi:hypothetical protein D0469_03655 [Peribacillus saganii]|uniref:Abortive phage infection protein n=1 Tax=Peribacillus saganii TaxID=2303992 RepID=A0A372LSM5_9BACI|nr:hypothetical protein [Peribacillus saganii]RFU71046.1 hypothetical protein D0469_03655 [Peribacillus saganii]
MREVEIRMILDQLSSREIEEFKVTKQDFLTFRSVLVTRPDFKHFRGIAQHGGEVIYRYMAEPRS